MYEYRAPYLLNLFENVARKVNKNTKENLLLNNAEIQKVHNNSDY